MKCPKCNSDNPDTKQFCADCGTQLTPAEEISLTRTKIVDAPVEEINTGSTFAGRYQIIEELGKGGMGKVYKALDQKINEKIALKLIKPEIASDKKIIERFSNELKIARKIGHRNVGRMYHLSEDEGTHYITMEYVSGEDLKSMIRMSGQLGIGTTINIAKQVCEGLAEAHRLGVVHRDLKPSNIMIDKEGSARIMDFGIARSLKEKGITGSGVMIGTPEYMSPEQVEAKEVDQRSDIYSLGVILYEMVTGRIPFEGDSPLSIAIKHKTEEPIDPRKFNTQLSEELELVILRCLEKDRETRYQSAEEVRSELENIEKGIPTTDKVIPERKPITSKEITVKFSLKKIFIPVVVILALAAASILLFRGRGPQLDPNRIVVAVFENQTGNPNLDHLGRIAHDWISQGLQQAGDISVATWLPEQTFEESKKESDFVRWISSETGSGKVVTGTYYLQGNFLQFHAKVHDAHKGKLLHALEPISGPIEDPMKIIDILRQRVMGQIAIFRNEEWSKVFLEGPNLPTYEAYREYLLGVQFFKGSDQKRSIDNFTKAHALDPDFIMPLLMLGWVHLNLGEYAEAEPVINKLDQSRDKLSPYYRYAADEMKAIFNGNLIAAYNASSKLIQLDREQNYNFAVDANYINRPKEAIEALKAIDPERGMMKGLTWYWDELTLAYHMLGDHKQELKEARRGRKQYPERFEALWNEVEALAALGRIKEVNKLIEESFALVPSAGGNPGRIMHSAGRQLREHGFKDASQKVLKRAIEWHKRRPQEEAKTRSHRSRLARLFYDAGMWEDAKSMFEVLHREYPEDVDFHGYIGSTMARVGNKEEALKISKQLKELEIPYLNGEHTFLRARIAAVLGEKENAINLLREALAQGVVYPYILPDMDLELLSDYQAFIELIKPKD